MQRNYQNATLDAFPELTAFPKIGDVEALGAYLQDLHAQAFVTRYVNFLLQAMAEDGSYIPLGSEGAVGIVASEEHTMVLRFYDPVRTKHLSYGNHDFLHSQSANIVMLMASSEPVTFQTWTYAYDSSRSLLDNYHSLILEHESEVTLEQGGLHFARANCDVGDYRSIDRPAIFLAITGRKAFDYTFAFDRISRRPIQIIAADNEDTRIEYVSRIFAELQSKGAVPQMLDLLTHASPTGRWQLARDILKLDADVGSALIVQMASQDEDIHVRRAAAQSMTILGLT